MPKTESEKILGITWEMVVKKIAESTVKWALGKVLAELFGSDPASLNDFVNRITHELDRIVSDHIAAAEQREIAGSLNGIRDILWRYEREKEEHTLHFNQQRITQAENDAAQLTGHAEALGLRAYHIIVLAYHSRLDIGLKIYQLTNNTASRESLQSDIRRYVINVNELHTQLLNRTRNRYRVLPIRLLTDVDYAVLDWSYDPPRSEGTFEDRESADRHVTFLTNQAVTHVVDTVMRPTARLLNEWRELLGLLVNHEIDSLNTVNTFGSNQQPKYDSRNQLEKNISDLEDRQLKVSNQLLLLKLRQVGIEDKPSLHNSNIFEERNALAGIQGKTANTVLQKQLDDYYSEKDRCDMRSKLQHSLYVLKFLLKFRRILAAFISVIIFVNSPYVLLADQLSDILYAQ